VLEECIGCKELSQAKRAANTNETDGLGGCKRVRTEGTQLFNGKFEKMISASKDTHKMKQLEYRTLPSLLLGTEGQLGSGSSWSQSVMPTQGAVDPLGSGSAKKNRIVFDGVVNE